MLLKLIKRLHYLPFTAHVFLAACLVVCAAFAGLALNHKNEVALIASKLSLQNINDQLKNAPLMGSQQGIQANFTTSLPSIAKSDDVLKEISRLAQGRTLVLDSIKVLPQAATTSELAKVQYSIAMRADYGSFKSWLGELMDRYSTLGVQNLSIRGLSNNANMQDINLTLQFFVKN